MEMSSRAIWKYELTPGENKLTMPVSSALRHVAMQGNLVCAWFEVNTKPTWRKVTRVFRLFATGQAIPSEYRVYCGTYVMAEGTLVFHLYENEAGAKSVHETVEERTVCDV